MNILSKFFYWCRLIRHPPVLVYQMGKVGSYSVYMALKKSYPGVVLHFHELSIHERWELAFLYKLIKRGTIRPRVVNLTREPISRNLSAFFYRLEKYFPEALRDDYFDVSKLQKAFIEKYPHDLPLNWYDMQLKQVFDIEILKEDFGDEGCAVYNYSNCEVLVMRMELDDEKKGELLGPFAEIENLKVERLNKIRDDKLKKPYQEFKKQIVLPENIINRLCDSEYFMHFYSNKFVEETRSEWLNRI